MKKTLALFLAVLVALSMFSVAAFAEASNYATVIFYDAPIGEEELGKEIKRAEIVPGEGQIKSHIPENPTRESDEAYDYTFKYWVDQATGVTYSPSNIPEPSAEDAGKTIIYVAEYSKTEKKVTQTFWNFIESIFERINLIFKYFAEIFRFEV